MPDPAGEADRGLRDRIAAGIDGVARAVIPAKVRNAALFVIPLRIGPSELLLAFTLLGVLAIWGATELRWQTAGGVELRSPVRFRRE